MHSVVDRLTFYLSKLMNDKLARMHMEQHYYEIGVYCADDVLEKLEGYIQLFNLFSFSTKNYR